jgi:folate-binding protein YgfZ
LSLTGPDSKDFLHRLSTVDVKNLAVGEGSPGCFLTPQGKIRASFTLWRDAADSYSFEFDPGQDQVWKNQVLSFIDQYTFGERMVLKDQDPEQECLWLFPSDERELAALGVSRAQATQVHSVLLESGLQLRICVHPESEFGRTWLTVWGIKNGRESLLSSQFSTLLSKESELSSAEIDLWRVLQLRPRVGFELTDEVSPLEIGLRKSIADQKGCYPGQEVVEKVISIGSPARRLVRIETLGPVPAPGDLIFSQDFKTEVGRVTSVAKELNFSQSSKSQVLGLVKKTFAKQGESVRFSSSQDTTGAMIQIAPYE